jgi:hypothetical protein
MAIEKGSSTSMFNLALLYEKETKDYSKAEKYYLMAIEKGYSKALNNLAHLYLRLTKNKKNALELYEEYSQGQDVMISYPIYIIMLLWNDKIEDAINIFNNHIIDKTGPDEVNEELNNLLLMFLAKKQYNFIYKTFQDPKYALIDKYKPVYYATLSLLGNNYSDEFKKMPPEIKETVEEILDEISKKGSDYS